MNLRIDQKYMTSNRTETLFDQTLVIFGSQITKIHFP